MLLGGMTAILGKSEHRNLFDLTALTACVFLVFFFSLWKLDGLHLKLKYPMIFTIIFWYSIRFFCKIRVSGFMSLMWQSSNWNNGVTGLCTPWWGVCQCHSQEGEPEWAPGEWGRKWGFNWLHLCVFRVWLRLQFAHNKESYCTASVY